MVRFTVLGEPASKSNSRRIVKIGNKTRLVKSAKALGYVELFRIQCPKLDPLIYNDVKVTMVIHYATRRPDLDESVILDAMQGLIYANDRQVKEKHIVWGLDRDNPRTEIVVTRWAGPYDPGVVRRLVPVEERAGAGDQGCLFD